jgi:tetratricopeptide (TPR) repeat protein
MTVARRLIVLESERMDTLTALGTLAVSAVVTGVQLSRMRSPQAMFALGATLVGGALAWPVAAYSSWALASWPWLPAVVAAGVGVAYLWPAYLFGFALGFVLIGADPSAAWLWIGSVAAGFAWFSLLRTRPARRRMANWLYFWESRQLMLKSVRAYQLTQSPRPFSRVREQDPLVLFSLVLAAVPAPVGLLVADRLMVVAVGVLVSTALIVHVLDLRELSRRFRRQQLWFTNFRVVLVIVLAAGPAGTWVAEGVHPPLLGVLLATVVFVLGMLLIKRQATGRVFSSAKLLALTSAGWLLAVFLTDGLFGFIAGGVAHFQPVLLVVAAVFAGYVLLNWARAAVPPMLAQNVSVLVNEWDGVRELTERIREAVRVRPAKPDLLLVTLVIAMAIRAPHGIAPVTHELYGEKRDRLRSEDALRWLQLAEDALTQVADEVTDPALLRILAYCRAQAASARANVHGYLSQREEAMEAYRQVVQLGIEAAAPNTAALGRTGLALVQGVRLRQRDGAMAELTPLLDDRTLSPATRRRAFHIAMVIERAFDDEEAVAALRIRRDRVVAVRADYTPLIAESALATSRRRLRGATREAHRMFEEQELLFGIQSPEGTEHSPVPQGSYRVAERELLDAGKLLASKGKIRRALVVLGESARIAEMQGHAQFVLMARSALSDVHAGQGNRVAAWANLSAAIEAHQRMRGMVLNADARSEVGGLWAQLFDQGVALLGAGPVALPGTGWPARPYVAAFELGELARSRALLELLGSRLTLDPSTGLSAEEETTAREELRQAADSVDAAPLSGREAALTEVRQASERLEQLYDGWQSRGGQAAEYVALRRGRPTPYEEIRRILADG